MPAKMSKENPKGQGELKELVSDFELGAASGGAGEAGMIVAAADAAKRIINGATADKNHIDDIKVLTQKEWDESSSFYQNSLNNMGSSFYGGDPTKIHYKVVPTASDKTDYVNKIKESNGGVSKSNPGW